MLAIRAIRHQGTKTLRQSVAAFRAFSTSTTVTVPIPWDRPVAGDTFNTNFNTEFRRSEIDGAGNGWFTLDDIPNGTMMRRVSIAEGSLLKFTTAEDFLATGWDLRRAADYGIGLHGIPDAIYFLNPGTTMNHADSTRDAAVKYVYNHVGDEIELWTVRDIQAGEEMLSVYQDDFAPVDWYDELQHTHGNTAIWEIPQLIESLYAEVPIEETATRTIGQSQ